MQALFREPGVDALGEIGVGHESGVRVEDVERAGVADRHQWQSLAFRQRENADIERIEGGRVDCA